MEDPQKPQGSLVPEIARTLGGWLTGQIKIAAILAVIYSIGFAVARVPWWPVVGVIGGASNVVPVVGPVIALGLAALALVFAEAELWQYITVLVVFVAAQTLEGFYLTPLILGRRLQLSGMTVFLLILAGGLMFGPLGVVLAAPVGAVAALIWRRIQARLQAQN